MQQALYRKYRSKKLDDVLGQEHITKTLSRALKTDHIRHAYLFTGPHGVGKTSVARILAHEINKLPYDGTSHLDIIEIDAASNRRIDEIRDLREKARIAPTSAQFKVYIIDEVHMLTNEAFNALLKTLEEPPEHVIFILATTEAHKLPETIISRTQRFQFLPIKPAVMMKHLAMIAKKEKIDISEDALEALAQHAEGSFRDAISLIDQVAVSGDSTISLQTVEQLLGIASKQSIELLQQAILAGDSKNTLKQLDSLISQGYAATTISGQLLKQLREQEVTSTTLQTMDQLLSVAGSSQPARKLEIIALGATLKAAPVTPVEAATPAPVSPTKKAPTVKKEQKAPQPSIVQLDPPKKKSMTAVQPSKEWSTVLESLKGSNSALYAMLRMAEARPKEGNIELAFRFPFHQKRAEETKTRDIIYEALKHAYGNDITYTNTVDATIVIEQPNSENIDQTVDAPTKDAANVLDIMGGGEVITYEDS